jgi:hypothetical protein
MDETTRLLATWRRRYRTRPDEERLRLRLLALEREQIVAVAYREEVLAALIRRLPVPPEVAELIRHALVWAWKDEELHAGYLRGSCSGPTGPSRPSSCTDARPSAVSGWVTTGRHPGDDPLESFAARTLVAVARLSGRLSPVLAAELRYRSFAVTAN